MPSSAYGQVLKQHLTNSEISDLLELIQDAVTCCDNDAFADVIEKLSLIVPVEQHACLFCQDCPDDRCLNYSVVSTNFHEEWVRTYLERNYSDIDPVMSECRDNTGIYFWSDVYLRRPPDPGFLSASRDFGLVEGYAASIQNLSGGRRGIISFSSGKFTKTGRNTLVMEIVAPHLYQAMDRIVYRQKLSDAPAVTNREKEVLKWIMCGKTSWETSVILGVSECTVRFHMNNVIKKLDATSRTHAVAIALAAGLVELD